MDNPYQQARCPECSVVLNTMTVKHADGCPYLQEQADLMRPANLSQSQQGALYAGMRNSQPTLTEELANRGTAPDYPATVLATLSGQPKR